MLIHICKCIPQAKEAKAAEKEAAFKVADKKAKAAAAALLEAEADLQEAEDTHRATTGDAGSLMGVSTPTSRALQKAQRVLAEAQAVAESAKQRSVKADAEAREARRQAHDLFEKSKDEWEKEETLLQTKLQAVAHG